MRPGASAGCAVLLLVSSPVRSQTAETAAGLDVAAVERFARLALDCVGREYPNKIAHVLQSDADVAPPRELTPAFCGCFDWHSSVHGHWLLARISRSFPEAGIAREARAALAADLTPEKIAREVAYLRCHGRASFERPYGLAWLLRLAADLRHWDDPQGTQWSATLAPLEQAAAAYNERAIKAYLKAGFVEEGRQRGTLLRDGQRWDFVYMSVLRDDWFSRET